MRRNLIAILFLFLTSTALAQPVLPFPNDARALGGNAGGLEPADTNPARFGQAIDSNNSLTNPLVIIGSPEKAGGGQAEIFSTDGTSWTNAATFTLPTPQSNARFGVSVAMYGMEGSDAVAVVGAPGYVNGAAAERGAVFVYRHDAVNGWELETELYPPATGDTHNFGSAVEVVGEGDFATIIVSSPDVAHNGFNNVGALYVYTWNTTDRDYMLNHTLYSGATQDDEAMGYSLGFDFFGSQLWVAASAYTPDWSGKVYVFHYDGVTWDGGQTILPPSPVTNGSFGGDLDLEVHNGDGLLLIGEPVGTSGAVTNAGLAHLFNKPDGSTTWSFDETLQPNNPSDGGGFGASVALSGRYADPIILIGEPGFDPVTPSPSTNYGMVYIFRDLGTFWYSGNQIYDPDEGDGFADAVELVGHATDGWLFIGSPNDNDPNTGDEDSAPGSVFYYDLVSDPVPPTEFTWVSNGSFETAGTSNYLPEGWILRKRLPGDGRSCGTTAGSGGVPGDKAYDGLCAFKFRGNDGKKAVLIFAMTPAQLETLIGQPISTDDSLTLTLRYKMKAPSKPLVRLIGWRAPRNITKFYHKVQVKPDGAAYADWHELSIEVPLTDTNFVELRLILKDKSKIGTWWVDNVHATYILDGALGGSGGEGGRTHGGNEGERALDLPSGFRR